MALVLAVLTGWGTAVAQSVPADTDDAGISAQAETASSPVERWGQALRQALVSPDRAALPRLAETIPIAVLDQIVRGRDRVAAIAAARALPTAHDNWSTLASLAIVARRPDRPVAVAAARAAVAIAEDLDPDQVAILDLPEDVVDVALAGWRAVGADPMAWVDVRVDALTVGAHLAAARGGGRDDFGFALDRLADAEPAIRRAALELLPFSAQLPYPVVAERLRVDTDPEVAVVAGQVLCSGLGFGDHAAPVLEALGEAGLTRLRELMADAKLPAIALLDAARCLAADGSPESRAALATLAKHGPREIRRAVARLGAER